MPTLTSTSGPGVAQGVVSTDINSHSDMAPTILQMLGVPALNHYKFDGAPIPYTPSALKHITPTELLSVEFWNMTGAPKNTGSLYYYNTYKALRSINEDYNLFYSKWCTGEREFYNMITDAAQMQNRLANPPEGQKQMYHGREEEMLYHRLDALLMVGKSCKEESCRDPWSVLFPRGQVSSLEDAMDPKYDDFFAKQPKVSYGSCEYTDAPLRLLYFADLRS